jgi:hypothetical protein
LDTSVAIDEHAPKATTSPWFALFEAFKRMLNSLKRAPPAVIIQKPNRSSTTISSFSTDTETMEFEMQTIITRSLPLSDRVYKNGKVLRKLETLNYGTEKAVVGDPATFAMSISDKYLQLQSETSDIVFISLKNAFAYQDEDSNNAKIFKLITERGHCVSFECEDVKDWLYLINSLAAKMFRGNIEEKLESLEDHSEVDMPLNKQRKLEMEKRKLQIYRDHMNI